MSPAKPSCESCPVRIHGVFSELAKDEVKELARARTANTYRKHSIIFYEGNPSLGLFCVCSGKIKIFKHGVNGRLQIARLSKPGDLLGYRALLADEPYSATGAVLEEAVICFLDKRFVMQMIRQNPGVCYKILQRVCQDLRVAERHALDVIHKPVVQRVAGLLLELQRDFGEPTPKGTRLGIELTREEMAEMIGTTAESLIRTLSDFKQKGWVGMEARHVFVKDSNELQKLLPQEA